MLSSVPHSETRPIDRRQLRLELCSRILDELHEILVANGGSKQVTDQLRYLDLTSRDAEFLHEMLTPERFARIGARYSSLLPVLETIPPGEGSYQLSQGIIRSAVFAPGDAELAGCWREVHSRYPSPDFFKPEGAMRMVAGKVLAAYPVRAADIGRTLDRLHSILESPAERTIGRVLFHGYHDTLQGCLLHQTWSEAPLAPGIAEVTALSELIPASPAMTCYLMQAARHCPVILNDSFFSNRNLGVAIAMNLSTIKEAVHSQFREAPAVIRKLVELHDGGYQPEDLAAARSSYRELADVIGLRISVKHAEQLICPENLTKPIRGMQPTDTVVDGLRQMLRNFEAPPALPPALEHLPAAKILDGRSSEEPPAFPALSELLQEVNMRLSRRYDGNELGIGIDLLHAVLWSDYVAARELSKVRSFEAQQGLTHQPWFKVLYRFHELTYPSSPTPAPIEDLLSGKTGFASRGRAVGGAMLEGFKRADEMFRELDRKPWRATVWSMNLSSKLLELLTAPLPADSAVGASIRRAEITPPWLFTNFGE